jgi:hypothetical protein
MADGSLSTLQILHFAELGLISQNSNHFGSTVILDG